MTLSNIGITPIPYWITPKKSTITNCLRACECIGIQYQDDGNIVPCGNVIVMTDKIIIENGYSKSKDNNEFVSKKVTLSAPH